MTVPHRAPASQQQPALLARIAEVLVANPAASLAEVARATGIGRTTLHSHYATRHDLILAVAHHSLDRCGEAVRAAADAAPGDDPGAALHSVVERLIPLGGQLAFVWRQPALDKDPAIVHRHREELDEPVRRLVEALREQPGRGLRTDQPTWWQISSLYALIYSAWEGVAHGALAPLDAPGLVTETLIRGMAAPTDPSAPQEARGQEVQR